MDLGGRIFEGLERSCAGGGGEKIVSAPGFPGIERIEAHFYGEAFELHRHDTYAIGVTLQGVQTFRYRGETRASRSGEIIVLHPDEIHDGGAGTEEGLRYRMLYLEPSLLRRCLDSDYSALPFVDQPIVADEAFRDTLFAALGALDEDLDELLVDDLVMRIAERLSRHGKQRLKPLGEPARRLALLARLSRRPRRPNSTIGRAGEDRRLGSVRAVASFPRGFRDEPTSLSPDAPSSTRALDDRGGRGACGHRGRDGLRRPEPLEPAIQEGFRGHARPLGDFGWRKGN